MDMSFVRSHEDTEYESRFSSLILQWLADRAILETVRLNPLCGAKEYGKNGSPEPMPIRQWVSTLCFDSVSPETLKSFVRWVAQCWTAWCAVGASCQGVCVGSRVGVSLWLNRLVFYIGRLRQYFYIELGYICVFGTTKGVLKWSTGPITHWSLWLVIMWYAVTAAHRISTAISRSIIIARVFSFSGSQVW